MGLHAPRVWNSAEGTAMLVVVVWWLLLPTLQKYS
jgi:hypothetical protein